MKSEESIYGQSNEQYLRSLIEQDEKQSTPEASNEALTKIITPKVQQEPDIRQMHGSKAIPTNILTSKGIFYPKDLVIAAFPLRVKSIRHFSSIDDTDGIDVDLKLKMIMEESIKVQSKEDPTFTVDSLLEIDRLFLLLVIRNMTFVEFPSTLTVKCECTTCQESDSVDVKAERIGSLKRDSLSNYLQRYSEEKRCISWQLGDKEVPLWLPSCHNLSVARTYLNNSAIDDRFMLCFLVPPSKKLQPKDFDVFEKEIDTWIPDKYILVKSFVKKVNESYSVDIYYQCSSCGAEVTAPLRFRKGIRELFVPEFSD